MSEKRRKAWKHSLFYQFFTRIPGFWIMWALLYTFGVCLAIPKWRFSSLCMAFSGSFARFFPFPSYTIAEKRSYVWFFTSSNSEKRGFRHTKRNKTAFVYGFFLFRQVKKPCLCSSYSAGQSALRLCPGNCPMPQSGGKSRAGGMSTGWKRTGSCQPRSGAKKAKPSEAPFTCPQLCGTKTHTRSRSPRQNPFSSVVYWSGEV